MSRLQTLTVWRFERLANTCARRESKTFTAQASRHIQCPVVPRQPDELTLLLIQLRRHQAKMAAARHHTLAQLQRLSGTKEPSQHQQLLANSPLGCRHSPVSRLTQLGLAAPVGPDNSQVGRRRRHACPSCGQGPVEVASKRTEVR